MSDAYDDATGQIIHAPVGNLSWGIGFNLKAIASPGLFEVMARYLLGLHDTVLSQYAWYNQMSDIHGSVPLDIAYNAGDAGEMLKFPRMVRCFEQGDLTGAAQECRVLNPRLDLQRYAPLRKILLS